MQVGIREVKAKCSEILTRAHNGDRIVVTKHGVPWADIVPHVPRKRTFGPLPGIVGQMSLKDAIAPLSKEELAEWE